MMYSQARRYFEAASETARTGNEDRLKAGLQPYSTGLADGSLAMSLVRDRLKAYITSGTALQVLPKLATASRFSRASAKARCRIDISVCAGEGIARLKTYGTSKTRLRSSAGQAGIWIENQAWDLLNESMDRRAFLKCCGTALLLSPLTVAGRDRRHCHAGFFVMDTWFWRAPELGAAAEAVLLKDLGFDGMALSWGHQHEARLESLRSQGLRVPGCYIVASIDNGYPSHLRECVEFLGGTGAWVWLALTSKRFHKSDSAGDSAALDILLACADEAKKAGLPGVVLYPHVGFWMEKVRDSLRLADKADRADIGLQFNQYHWMVEEERGDLQPLLHSVKKHLKGVSVNGSNQQSPNILPLNEGDYDVSPLLAVLSDVNYDGPISHQGYSIEGNLPERLAAAKAEWERLKMNRR